MFDLRISFAYPWLLMLLIPAFALGLFPYFRMAKKYRRNRNRVCSTVLHLIVMTLAIFVISGVSFPYKEYNDSNEILFLVDASYSTKEEEAAKERYMQDVVNMSNAEVYSIGIVTFGYDQNYAVPLTDDYGSIFGAYENAEKPDTSATDIASALEYAATLFNNPESGKIVLISDGIETDGRAASVIRSISASGIRVDTVCCSSLKPEGEIQIVDVKFPEYTVTDGDSISLTLTVKSDSSPSVHTSAHIEFYDGDERISVTDVDLTSQYQDVIIDHTVVGMGLHPLRFVVSGDSDNIEENNELYSYLYLDTFDKILILESRAGISERLETLLADYTVNVLCPITDVLPATIDELRQYDEVILNNIANDDMPEAFVSLLNTYVYEYGGGLFTVGGGEDGEPETAHALNRKDMAGTLYQQMLPVQAIDYTPPLGLVIIIDASGSMQGNRLEVAKDSARSIVRDGTCLSDRDYCAIISLSDKADEKINLVPMTRQQDILEAIHTIDSSGGTLFSPSIERAALDLIALKSEGRIEKMHIIMITDGGVAGADSGYVDMVSAYHEQGVSFSFVGIGAYNMSQLQQAAENGGGRAISVSEHGDDLTLQLKDDVRVPEIKEVEYGEFKPVLNENSYYASVITQSEMPSLDGFYGTKARSSAEVALFGEYNIPIYAQWKYGKGTVGSFMCDLDGTWSSKFLDDEAGQRLLLSFVKKIFPTEDIRTQDITVTVNEQNYKTQLSLYPTTPLNDGESLRVSVVNLVDESYNVVIEEPLKSENYSRASFVATAPGLYRISIERVNASGEVMSTTELYRSFSYSKEYSLPADVQYGIEYLEQIAAYGEGEAVMLEDAQPWRVLEGFITFFEREFDPTLTLMIIAIVLFLLDIAVRKFKFKWIHELVREHKAKKADRQKEDKA